MRTRLIWDSMKVDLNYKTLEEAINILEKLREEFGDEARLDVTTEYGYGYDEPVVELNFRRPWTKEELAEEKKKEEEELIRDRAQWERLAKKFGVVTDKEVI